MHEQGPMEHGGGDGDGDDARPVIVEYRDHLEIRLSVQRTCPRHREGCVALVAPLVRARGVQRLLVVCTDPSDTIDRIEAYWTGEALARLLANVRVAIAVPLRPVDYLEDFAATVARQRGGEVRYFGDVDAARRWLLA